MSINLGNTTFGSLYLGSTKIGEAYLGSVKVYGSAQPDPYNPLNLPPYTMRLQFKPNTTPRAVKAGTLTQVSADPNVWDWTYTNTSWYDDDGLFYDQPNLIAVLGANSTGVTNMGYLFVSSSNLASVEIFDTSSVTNLGSVFGGCRALSSVPLFDTSAATDMSAFLSSTSVTSIPSFNTALVTDMSNFCDGTPITSFPLLNTSAVTKMTAMFDGCSSLQAIPALDTSNVRYCSGMYRNCTSITSIPLLNTSKMTQTTYMFDGCSNVESGALALYTQMSTQATVPQYHTKTFRNCGSNTTTGAAELAQIDSGWK